MAINADTSTIKVTLNVSVTIELMTQGYIQDEDYHVYLNRRDGKVHLGFVGQHLNSDEWKIIPADKLNYPKTPPPCKTRKTATACLVRIAARVRPDLFI